MSTNNPKVSAYIPQHIYDSFKSFYEQRGISMSQAVAVIFAEYFGLDSAVDQKSSTSGLLVERVGLLEQKFTEFRELFQKHLQSGGAMQEKEYFVVRDGGLPEAVSLDVAEPTSITPSELLGNGSLPEPELPKVLENVEAWLTEGDLPKITPSGLVNSIPGRLLENSDLPEAESSEILENAEIPLVGKELAEATPSELLGVLAGKLLEDSGLPNSETPEVLENAEVGSVESGLPETNPSESLGGLPSKPLKQDESLEIVKPDIAPVQQSLSYPEIPLFPIPGNPTEGIQPISGRKLSKQRFGLSEDTLSGAKKRLKTAQRLIDWTREKDPDGIAWKMVETPVPGFVPVDELSSELRNKLLIWIRENGLS